MTTQKYFAELTVNGTRIFCSELDREQPGQFVKRRWLTHPGFFEQLTPTDHVRCRIGTQDQLVIDYTLTIDQTGKLTSSHKKGGAYSWCNIVDGRGPTVGVTIGLNIRSLQEQQPEQLPLWAAGGAQ